MYSEVCNLYHVHYSYFYHINPNNILGVETPLDPCNNNFSTSQPLSLEIRVIVSSRNAIHAIVFITF